MNQLTEKALLEKRILERQRQRAWREANREKERQRMRSRDKAMRAASNLRTRSRHVARAHEAVRKALRNGQLVKPSQCSRCAGGKRIEAHHDDYNKPLDVRWLCQQCHGLRHRELHDQQEAA